MGVNLASTPLQPSLFVGLGQTGIRCLELIQRRLSSNPATGSRLLGIRMAGDRSSSHAGLLELDEENVLDLPWDHSQASRLAKAAPGYEWWLESDSFIERLDARMAFHVMKYFQRDDRLSDWLRRFIQRFGVNKDNPLMLYVIVSLQDPESGFLGDLILEILNQVGIDKISVRFPCLIVDSERKDASYTRGWVSASLREIERFMQKGQSLGGLLAETPLPYELFGHWLFIDNENYLPALADQLVALAEKKTAIQFGNNLGNLDMPPRFSMTVSKSFTFSIPIEEIRQVCAARLIKEELLRETYYTDSELHTLAREFLRGKENHSALEWDFFRLLAYVLDGKDAGLLDGLHVIQAHSVEILVPELGRFLNTEFKGTPKDVEQFLRILLGEMTDAIEKYTRAQRSVEWMRQRLPVLRSVISDFSREISRWIKVWDSLERLTEQQHKKIAMEILASKWETEYCEIILREGSKQTGSDPFDTYYLDLKEHSGWQGLILDVRKLLGWQWETPKGQKPYLRCLVEDTAYVEAQDIAPILWKETVHLIAWLANADSIFDYLGRLGYREIAAMFERAPVSLRCDPLPAPERRSHRYLVCANDPMIHTWNLHPSIQHCQINEKERLTYLEFEHNLPVDGARFLHDNTLSNQSIEAAFVFPHEQNAWKIEQKMSEKRLKGQFPAQFVRLMHQREHFETAMGCVFWGWLVQKKMGLKTCWQIDTQDGAEPICLDAADSPALSLEEALFNFLVRIPLEDISGLHPLSKGYFPATIARLRKKNMEYQNLARSKRAEFYEPLQEKIQIWQHSPKPFDRGLALYQTYLLAENKTHKQK